jgi:hypothetical protein
MDPWKWLCFICWYLFFLGVLLGTLFGLCNYIFWNSPWLFALVVASGGSFYFWIEWQENLHRIARMREHYSNLGYRIEEYPTHFHFVNLKERAEYKKRKEAKDNARAKQIAKLDLDAEDYDALERFYFGYLATGLTQLDKPLVKDSKRWKSAILCMLGVVLVFAVAGFFGGKFGFVESMTVFGSLAAWMSANGCVAYLAVSSVYFLATRLARVLPWRIKRVLKLALKEGIIERDGKNYRVAHTLMHEYLVRKARYSGCG